VDTKILLYRLNGLALVCATVTEIKTTETELYYWEEAMVAVINRWE